MKKFFHPKNPLLWMSAVVVMAAVVLCVLFIPRSVDVPSALDECVVSTLCEVHYSSHTEGKYPAVTYTALATEKKGEEVTLYGVMMYREYTCTTQNKLEVWGAAHYPFAITATENADGSYTATDCWWPENGAEHVPSIRKKFPSYCQRKAVKYSKFYTQHDAACNADATQNIADGEKYTVLKSERENIRLGYCAKTETAYINFSGGYIADGAYAWKDGQVLFTFGERELVFTVDGDAYVYNKEASKNIPAVWVSVGNTEYFTDGVRFVLDDGSSHPIVKEDTAPVGPTFTVTSSNWMDETTLREMFGQHVPSTYFDSDNPKYLPVRPIENRAQLERFVAAFADTLPGMEIENFAQYDEAFFENNYVMITYYKDGYDSCEPKIDSYVYVQDGTSLWLSVRLEVEKPAAGDTVVGQWLLFSGIAKEDFKKANALEAYVENVVTTANADATTLSFTGTVTQVDGHAALMSCDSVPQFNSGVWVELGGAELDPMVGETYVVTYEDIVMPSLPPRITAITITKP